MKVTPKLRDVATWYSLDGEEKASVSRFDREPQGYQTCLMCRFVKGRDEKKKEECNDAESRVFY